jgi:hypothetical protein
MDYAQKPAPPGFVDQIGRQVGLAGRAVAQGVAGMPMMAMDAGVAARNLGHNLMHGQRPTLADFNPFAKSGGTHQEYELPSHTFNQQLTQAGLPEPQNAGEKVAGFVESGLTGSRMPVPQAAHQAPEGFVRPADMQRQLSSDVIRRGQDMGLKVPPATTNRTLRNMTLETVAGKAATQQGASSMNQGTVNSIGKGVLGLNPDAPLTEEAANAVARESGQAGYEPLRAAGTLTAPASFHERLVSVLSKYRGAERSFPGMGKTDLADMVEKVDQPQFDAGDAIDLTRILRDKASVAFRAGDTGTGQGIRDISNAVEDAMDKGLRAKGPQFADLVDTFRAARQKIAIAHTVGDAINPGTGNLVAAKLAAALDRGEPLSGPLRDLAKFAKAVPKAVAEPTHSMGVNHLDMYAPLTTMMFGHGLAEKAAGLAVPITRWGAKRLLFSPWGQAGALPGAVAPNTGAIPAGLLGAQQSLK